MTYPCPPPWQVRLKWHVVTVPVEMSYLAVLNYHQQGLFVAAAKYLLTCFLSLLVGFCADRSARLDFLAATASLGGKPRPGGAGSVLEAASPGCGGASSSCPAAHKLKGD
jgi:hypothetical protein